MASDLELMCIVKNILQFEIGNMVLYIFSVFEKRLLH